MLRRQIPNLITLGNLLCGVLACKAAALWQIELAALFICLGIFLDFFDGLAARLLGVASPLGKELDSLADVVTSGVAPGFILYVLLHRLCLPNPIALLAYLIPLFAAYRLAKFNLDTRQSHSFLGLPVPANALIWVGLALWQDMPRYTVAPGIALLVISLITNVLMVSEMPMFSLKFNFKDMNWKSNSEQYLFLIGCVALVAVSRQWYAISLIILWYIVLSVITRKKHVE